METRNYTSAKDPLNFDADPDPGHLFFFFLLTSVQHLEFRSCLIISLIFNSLVLSFKTKDFYRKIQEAKILWIQSTELYIFF